MGLDINKCLFLMKVKITINVVMLIITIAFIGYNANNETIHIHHHKSVGMHRPGACCQSDVYGYWRQRIRSLSDGCFHNGSIYPIHYLSLIHLQDQLHPSLLVGLLDYHTSVSDYVGVGIE